MEYDPLSLIHGFQISVKNKLTFVGLRSPRALTASILGLNCERVSVPGIRFDPIGTGEAGQAIFQKQRVTAANIEAHFSIDVGLLSSLRLDTLQNGLPGQHQNARFQLLMALALWKVAAFLDLLRIELSLRTECKLRLKGNPRFKTEGQTSAEGEFLYQTIAQAPFNSLISQAHLPSDRHPLVLKYST
jgi:CRISPR-associated protein Csb1